jgi:hypothetical protein
MLQTVVDKIFLLERSCMIAPINPITGVPENLENLFHAKNRTGGFFES